MATTEEEMSMGKPKTKFPHGDCECRDGCQCESAAGPAAFAVERDGRLLNVCTRCTLPSDVEKHVLATRDDDASVYSDYDILGFVVICGALDEARPTPTKDPR